MASTQSALRKMREIYLSLPDTSEGEHFGESIFRVNAPASSPVAARRQASAASSFNSNRSTRLELLTPIDASSVTLDRRTACR